MAKFKVGDRARFTNGGYTAPSKLSEYNSYIGRECTIIKIGYYSRLGYNSDYVIQIDGRNVPCSADESDLEPIIKHQDYASLAAQDVKSLMDKIKQPIVA